MALDKSTLPREQIAAFSRRWQVRRFALFGSILRDDFGPESDVDVLLDFAPGAPWTLFDLTRMKDELQRVFDRPVDILTRPAVEASRNRVRRDAILSSAEIIYAA